MSDISNNWINELTKIINKLIERKESEPFRKPVDYEGLGLNDYLTIITNPIDLNTILKNIKKGNYIKKEECIQDIKLVFKNAMLYNNTGSKLYNTAQLLLEDFEELLEERYSGRNRPPSIAECTELIENCYKLNPEELSQVITLIDKKCPSALRKRVDDNEILIDIDLISSPVYHELSQLIKNILTTPSGLFNESINSNTNHSSTSNISTSSTTTSSNKKRNLGESHCGDSLANLKKRR